LSVLVPEQTGYPAQLEEWNDSNFDHPESWPENLHPMDNQRVKDWLMGHGEWEGQEPGWKHYALDPQTAAMNPGTWAWRNKRAMDVTLTLLGLPFVLPIMGLAAAALFFTAGKDKNGKRDPIFFKQWRPGYLCKPFQIYKFRTMRTEGDSESPREDAHRLTRFGRFLRNTSIDELPQLFNVLKGEMSLVGPRPQLMTYLARSAKEDLVKFGGLQGISGLAQVTGRNAHTWSERTNIDANYWKVRTAAHDFWIVLTTIPLVFLRKGISEPGQATNSEFPVKN